MSEVPPEIVEVGAVATLDREPEDDTEELDGAASEGGTADEEPEDEDYVVAGD